MRVTCKSACLVYYEHSKYCGIIQDFSRAGAAVRLFGANAGFIRTGDICSLVFCTDPESDCRSYTSRITRISPHLIALEFLEMPS